MLIKHVQVDGKLNNIFTVNLMSVVKRKNKKQNTNSSHCNLQCMTTSFPGSIIYVGTCNESCHIEAVLGCRR